jgi:hypothetical protein
MVIRYAGLFIGQQFKKRRRPEILKSYATNLNKQFTFKSRILQSDTDDDDDDNDNDDNNNNNNNNNNKLQLGFHPVAVVILHVKYKISN